MNPRRAGRGRLALAVVCRAACAACATPGRLTPVVATVAPVLRDTVLHDVRGRPRVVQTWRPMFSDTLIGLVPGTGDSSRRYLGRLREGYAADTLNVIMFGDNRPGWRAARLQKEYATMHKMWSGRPKDFL